MSLRFPGIPPTFNIGEFVLRGMRRDDRDSLFALMSDRAVTQFMTLHADTRTQVSGWMSVMQDRFEDQQAIYWVIVNSADRAIGRIHLMNIAPKEKRSEIG
jgi:RimJ/RimL family protein N-acetyltransferase